MAALRNRPQRARGSRPKGSAIIAQSSRNAHPSRAGGRAFAQRRAWAWPYQSKKASASTGAPANGSRPREHHSKRHVAGFRVCSSCASARDGGSHSSSRGAATAATELQPEHCRLLLRRRRPAAHRASGRRPRGPARRAIVLRPLTAAGFVGQRSRVRGPSGTAPGIPGPQSLDTH